MAKARMLHREISVSVEVNRLSIEARLLFTWMIPHADDEGRLKGEAEFIKAVVVPMTDWSFEKINSYLNEMFDIALIYRWQQKNKWYIEFPNWNAYQYLRGDRFKKSMLPSYKDNQLTTNVLPEDNHMTPQSNVIKENKKEINKVENKPLQTSLEKIKNTLINKGIYHPKKEENNEQN